MTEPELTQSALTAFIHAYRHFTRLPPNPANEQALADMVVRSWPMLDGRSRDWIARLEQLMYDDDLDPAERAHAEHFWSSTFNVVHGCLSVPDPQARAFRFADVIRFM